MGSRTAIPFSYLTLCAASSLVIPIAGACGQAMQWTQLQPSLSPSVRYHPGMVYDSTRSRVVLYGGFTNSNAGPTRSADTWEWNGTTWTQLSVSGPATRSSPAMAFDSGRALTVMFGGISEGGSILIPWEFDGQVWSSRPTSGPIPAAQIGSPMCYDAARAVCVYVVYGQTWEWNGTAGTWTQRSQTGPSSRIYGGLVYDTSRGVSVLFGGKGLSTSDPPLADTWEWNGSAWSQRAVSGPSARYDHAMVYDTSRHVVFVQGGQRSSTLFVQASDSWEFNGTAWTPRTYAGPLRSGQGYAFDSAHGGCVMFGGYIPTSSLYGINETWTLSPCDPVAVSVQPNSQQTCRGQPFTFSAITTGSGPLAYQWRHAIGTASALPIPGATSATFTIPAASASDAGRYECVVTSGTQGVCGTATATAAFLHICAADTNCSGSLDVQDIFDFLNAWLAGSPSADFNTANGLEIQDIFDFLNTWLAGC